MYCGYCARPTDPRAMLCGCCGFDLGAPIDEHIKIHDQRRQLATGRTPVNHVLATGSRARAGVHASWRRASIADAGVEAVARAIDVLGDPDTWDAAPYYDSLGLAVMDSIWSMGVRYEGVLNVIGRYRALRARQGANADGDTTADVATVIGRPGGPAAFADVILNRQRTSSRNGILKAEAVLLAAQMLASAGVLRPGDLAEASPARFAAIQEAWKKVPGQSSMISWRYFLMLARHPGVKPDRMVRRFVADALGRPDESAVSAAEAETLVTAAAELLGLDLLALDYAIWRHQR